MLATAFTGYHYVFTVICNQANSLPGHDCAVSDEFACIHTCIHQPTKISLARLIGSDFSDDGCMQTKTTEGNRNITSLGQIL